MVADSGKPCSSGPLTTMMTTNVTHYTTNTLVMFFHYPTTRETKTLYQLLQSLQRLLKLLNKVMYWWNTARLSMTLDTRSLCDANIHFNTVELWFKARQWRNVRRTCDSRQSNASDDWIICSDNSHFTVHILNAQYLLNTQHLGVSPQQLPTVKYSLSSHSTEKK